MICYKTTATLFIGPPLSLYKMTFSLLILLGVLVASLFLLYAQRLEYSILCTLIKDKVKASN